MNLINYKFKLLISLFFIASLYSCSADASKISTDDCYLQCEYWEYCNTDSNKCELNTDSGYCNSDTDCINNKKCNQSNYTCETKVNNCVDGCYEWETCVDGICKLIEGACYWDGDCSNLEYCDSALNRCSLIDTSCDLDCNSWETCKISDNGERACITEASFNWIRLKIQDENNFNSIIMPYGVNAYGYDPKSKIMVSYFTKFDNNYAIGELSLLDGIQKEKVLNNNGVLLMDNFCEENTNDCQFISYNKNKEKFMLLGLTSNSLVYFNTYNIMERNQILGLLPVFSDKKSAIFNESGEVLFVYNTEIKADSSLLYSFSSIQMKWKLQADKLPSVSDNCLVEADGFLYSFGGVLWLNEDDSSYTQKYYKINYIDNSFEANDIPEALSKRGNINCAYDNTRKLIFIYGGSEILDEENEVNNNYYSDLWSFNIETKEWKLILKITNQGTYLPPDEDGNRIFNADIEKPVFGKNKGRMIYDEVDDRLILQGEVPPNKGIQLYTINLKK